jgi:DNA-binding MarR family transcriptional regulator
VTHSPESFTPKPGSLLQRGNYAIFRILSIINAAGPKGITTVTLHQRLGTHTNRTNAIIRKAHELGYIDRIKGEFAPILNVITEKGRQLLASTMQ